MGSTDSTTSVPGFNWNEKAILLWFGRVVYCFLFYFCFIFSAGFVTFPDNFALNAYTLKPIWATGTIFSQMLTQESEMWLKKISEEFSPTRFFRQWKFDFRWIAHRVCKLWGQINCYSLIQWNHIKIVDAPKVVNKETWKCRLPKIYHQLKRGEKIWKRFLEEQVEQFLGFPGSYHLCGPAMPPR